MKLRHPAFSIQYSVFSIPHRRRGFTLIELMVAVVLASFILWCCLKIFAISTELTSVTNYSLESHANAAVVVQRLEREVSAALTPVANSTYFRIGVDTLNPQSPGAGYNPVPSRYGNATGGSAGGNVLEDATQQWRENEFRGLFITAGGGSHRIVSNTNTRITIEDTFATAPGYYVIPYLLGRMEFCAALGGTDRAGLNAGVEYQLSEIGYRVVSSDDTNQNGVTDLETERVLKRWAAFDLNFTSNPPPAMTLWECNPCDTGEERWIDHTGHSHDQDAAPGERTDLDQSDEMGANITDFFVEYWDDRPAGSGGDVFRYPLDVGGGGLSKVTSVTDGGGTQWLNFAALPRAIRFTIRTTDFGGRTAKVFTVVIALPGGGSLQ